MALPSESQPTTWKGVAARQAHILTASAPKPGLATHLRSESTLAAWTMPLMPFSTRNSSQWMHEQYAPVQYTYRREENCKVSASPAIAMEGHSPEHV